MTFEVVLRTSVILLVAWTASRALARSTPATRHLLWHCALAAVLLAPAIGPLLPRYDIVLPAMHTRPLPAAAFGPLPQSRDGQPLAPEANGVRDIWLAGFATIGLWFCVCHLRARRLLQNSIAAPADVQHVADSIAAEMGMSKPIAVRLGPAPSPLTVGVLRRAILLPAASATWDLALLRVGLLHELAHVRRGDCRTQAVAQAACAVYWFNPLVWIAASRLRIERERACDDEVLAHGALPSAYASHLIDVARDAMRSPAPRAVLAMARPRELEGRLISILDARRGRVPRRRSRWGVLLLVMAVTLVALAPHTAARTSVARDLALVVPGKDADTREKAAMLLAFDRRADAIPPLLAALRDPDAQVREKAALGLAGRSDPRVLDPLLEALRDEDSQVREKAAIALGFSAAPRARPALAAALRDPVQQVREKAAAGLILLGVRSTQP